MYSYIEVDKFLIRYSEIENSEVIQTREGILGSGDWVCTAPGKKTAIIKEVFINSWNSSHTIKMYNETPKKYLKLTENINLI
jgi:hypothetical protein